MPAISGTVTAAGQPVGGAYVRLYGPSSEFVAEIYTRDDGAFVFHVAEGEWRLEARAADRPSAERAVSVGDADQTVSVEV